MELLDPLVLHVDSVEGEFMVDFIGSAGLSLHVGDRLQVDLVDESTYIHLYLYVPWVVGDVSLFVVFT